MCLETSKNLLRRMQKYQNGFGFGLLIPTKAKTEWVCCRMLAFRFAELRPKYEKRSDLVWLRLLFAYCLPTGQHARGPSGCFWHGRSFKYTGACSRPQTMSSQQAHRKTDWQMPLYHRPSAIHVCSRFCCVLEQLL